jgi:mannose-6-phosphate isomerase
MSGSTNMKMSAYMKQPIFFTPVFKERIWGGTQLRERFGYAIPSEQTGECWAFSAHPNGQSVVRDGVFQGKTLGDLWDTHRELFGGISGDTFPLLTKLLDANQDLSVQVHPNDEYAMHHENGELGKTECWYIIDCKPDAKLVYGHRAKTKEEARAWIENGKWSEFLNVIDIKPGDFFYVPSGTIHALKEGTLVLETQQNSDTTYRLYDYDRRDSEGNLRELHIEKSLDVMTVPHQNATVHPTKTTIEDLDITIFVQNEFFSVNRWSLHGHAKLQQRASFLLVSVIEGSGTITNVTTKNGTTQPFRAGDHFLLPSEYGEFELNGETELIVSHL